MWWPVAAATTAVAILPGKRTADANGWIAGWLAMGQASTVSRLPENVSAYSPKLRKLERAFHDGGSS
jgi:hypothetical protein